MQLASRSSWLSLHMIQRIRMAGKVTLTITSRYSKDTVDPLKHCSSRAWALLPVLTVELMALLFCQFTHSINLSTFVFIERCNANCLSLLSRAKLETQGDLSLRGGLYDYDIRTKSWMKIAALTVIGISLIIQIIPY